MKRKATASEEPTSACQKRGRWMRAAGRKGGRGAALEARQENGGEERGSGRCPREWWGGERVGSVSKRMVGRRESRDGWVFVRAIRRRWHDALIWRDTPLIWAGAHHPDDGDGGGHADHERGEVELWARRREEHNVSATQALTRQGTRSSFEEPSAHNKQRRHATR
eukprot:2536639-Prymnesium_polylepis.2